MLTRKIGWVQSQSQNRSNRNRPKSKGFGSIVSVKPALYLLHYFLRKWKLCLVATVCSLLLYTMVILMFSLFSFILKLCLKKETDLRIERQTPTFNYQFYKAKPSSKFQTTKTNKILQYIIYFQFTQGSVTSVNLINQNL